MYSYFTRSLFLSGSLWNSSPPQRRTIELREPNDAHLGLVSFFNFSLFSLRLLKRSRWLPDLRREVEVQHTHPSDGSSCWWVQLGGERARRAIWLVLCLFTQKIPQNSQSRGERLFFGENHCRNNLKVFVSPSASFMQRRSGSSLQE